MQRPNVTVVGSFAVGLTIRAPRFPVSGETLIGTDFDMGPGGKGSNQAVGAARLGAASALVAMIGTDSFGELGTALYRHEGVATDFVKRTPACHTGVGFITLNAAGDNHIVLDPGANKLLSPEDVDAAEGVIAASDAVVSVLEIRAEVALRAMELGRRHGATTILNPAPAASLDSALLALVDVLTPNESELRILLGLQPDHPGETGDLARQLLARGVRQIVVTRGATGALIVHSDGTTEHVAGVPIEVVDTTGAGDAFTCALAVALAEGNALPAAVRFAACAGALACTQLGVIPALPKRDAVDDFMHAQFPGTGRSAGDSGIGSVAESQ